MTERTLTRIAGEAAVAEVAKWATKAILGLLWVLLATMVLRAFPLLPLIVGLMTVQDWLPWVGLVLASVLLLIGISRIAGSISTAYAPIYRREPDRLDLDKFIDTLSVVTHGGLTWKPTMPPVPDAAIGNSYLPFPSDIAVRAAPICPHCANILLSRYRVWPLGTKYYCVNCDWHVAVRGSLTALRAEATNKAQGAYSALLAEKGLSPGIEHI